MVSALPRDMLVRGLSVLICIGFALWLSLRWSGYAETHVRDVEGWRLGGVSMVELTLVPQDKERLACASNADVAGLRCAFQASMQPWPLVPDAERRLSPYSTIHRQLLLGAGLWAQPALRGRLPQRRFSVVCNFHVQGVIRSASVRWEAHEPFDALQEAIAVGTLSDCVIPP